MSIDFSKFSEITMNISRVYELRCIIQFQFKTTKLFEINLEIFSYLQNID